MSRFEKQRNDQIPARYPENGEGDFYVQNQACITCGVPESVAPDLIEHSKNAHGHCFFKKQPQTQEEVDRAIEAIAVSCIGGLRYGGEDQTILKRLYAMGLGEQCDNRPSEVNKWSGWNQG